MSKSRHTGAQMIGALKQLEAGRKAEDVARNTRLRKLVADLSLDNEALQSVIRKTAGARSPEGGCRAGAGGVCLERAAGVRSDDGGGIELPLPDEAMG